MEWSMPVMGQGLLRRCSLLAFACFSLLQELKGLSLKAKARYWRCRYESQIVKQMIINDGGSGSFVETFPETLSIWETLLTVRPWLSHWHFCLGGELLRE